MDYKYLKIERTGHVATLTLNRPKSLNALNNQFLIEIEHAAQSFGEDEQTRAVIFRGQGKHFSAGADLKEKPPGKLPSLVMQRRITNRGARAIRAIVEIDQITIAAIHGVALGGGACIASACDLRIGADSCAIGYPEVKLGIPLMWGGLPLCVNLIGPSRAKRMIMLGNHETAETLLDWGYLDEIVPEDDLRKRSLELAEEYAACPPIPLQMIKRSINSLSMNADAAIMHMETDQTILSAMTEDRAESMQAFFENREPEFKGN